MKLTKKHLLLGLFITLPQLTLAQQGTVVFAAPLGQLIVNILIFINNYLIPFIVGMGFLFFVWGMFKYFILGGADEEKKVQGRSLMVHATLGFVLIIIFFGIVNMFASSTGLDGQTVQGVPTVAVP